MLNWTFAEDFWESKTTHLAISSVLGAIGAVTTHHAAAFPTFALALGTVAVAFLRDTHAKAAEVTADLLEEVIQAIHGTDSDGEADAPVPGFVPVLPPTTISTNVTGTLSPENVAKAVATLGVAVPNPKEAQISGDVIPPTPGATS